jgi:hypothetical protein
MATSTKDTIYIDVDDEITAIIDKIGASKHKIVALVLPKRATMLQSIVNMKLLKRSADELDKHVVLITTEAGLLPLAGAVGMHVAATPQSKPVIPSKPESMSDEPENVEEPYDDALFTSQATTPIGELTGMDAGQTDEDTIQLDNAEDDEAVGASAGAAATSAKKAKSKPPKGKNKKLKVPDFNSFRNRLLIGGGALLLLIVLWVFAAVVLPKATLAVKTDSQDIDSSLDVTFDTKATSVNVDDGVVPATIEQNVKTTTQSAPATGQQNNGEKAEGQVVLSSDDITICAPNKQITIPAGTGVSTNGLTYITQQSGTIGRKGNTCIFDTTVGVVASKGGANYNVSSASFTVQGYSNVTGKSSGAINGGTDEITKVVTQSDINAAKEKLAAQVDSVAKDELSSRLEDKGLYVVKESFSPGNPEVTASAKAGDQVDSVTVTQKTTYTMTGAKKDDIEDLIKASIEDQIDKSKQEVLNTGLDKGVFKLQSQDGTSKVLMGLAVTSLAGPRLDDEAIKTQVAGKKANEAKEILKSYPGVTDVEVNYSPFWVSSIPKKTSKIKIIYEK